MARTGQVTLYKGIGKASKKPFSALRIEVGSFTKLVFLNEVEKLYVEKYLAGSDEPREIPSESNLQKEGKTIIDDELKPQELDI